jgi:hypothetical protein
VRYVELLVDGQTVSKFDYIAECPYQNFEACPAKVSGILSWDSGTVPDGQHEVALRVVNAGGNGTIVDDHTITTQNLPSVTSPPTISGASTVGSILTASPAVISSKLGAGSTTITGQWLRCDSTGVNCVEITGATGTSYNLSSKDLAAAIRYEETARDTGGSTITQSTPLGPIGPSAAEQEKTEREKTEKAEKERTEKQKAETEKTEKERIEREKVEKEKTAANGANGTNGTDGANGAPSAGGAGGSAVVSAGTPVLVNVSPGSNLGLVPLGSSAKWVVSLKVSPSRVRRHTPIKLTGTVSTYPHPTNGKLIDLQARSVATVWKGQGSHRRRVTVYGKWLTFQALRAAADGKFSSTYEFRLGGTHTYQFLAVAPAEGQYLDPTGTSPISTVHEV